MLFITDFLSSDNHSAFPCNEGANDYKSDAGTRRTFSHFTGVNRKTRSGAEDPPHLFSVKRVSCPLKDTLITIMQYGVVGIIHSV